MYFFIFWGGAFTIGQAARCLFFIAGRYFRACVFNGGTACFIGPWCVPGLSLLYVPGVAYVLLSFVPI
jgi:hypothetical protein